MPLILLNRYVYTQPKPILSQTKYKHPFNKNEKESTKMYPSKKMPQKNRQKNPQKMSILLNQVMIYYSYTYMSICVRRCRDWNTHIGHTVKKVYIYIHFVHKKTHDNKTCFYYIPKDRNQFKIVIRFYKNRILILFFSVFIISFLYVHSLFF